MSRRLKKGGAAELVGQEIPDLLQFYDRYLRKSDPEMKVLQERLSVNSSTTSSLIVIDMQNDFVLPPPQGAFSVADGINVIEPLVAFIDANKKKFTKIVFSRDTHDSEHCSFSSNEGVFPDHCVINQPGSQIKEEFKKYKAEPNVSVIFKGMHPLVDSFGAHKYPNDAYSSGRQLGKRCCKIDPMASMVSCSDATGGRYLKDSTKAFEDKPFTNQSATKFSEIEGDLSAAFQTSDLLNGQTSGEHTIFVVGLAGDFCVKDTAINIMKDVKAQGGLINGVKINVYVIEPFVRYAFLPLMYAVPITTANIKNTNPNKGLSKYVFKTLDNGKKTILSAADITGISNISNIQGDYHYARFLTDTSTIIDDYSGSGVKLLMSAPELSTTGGGKTKRRTKRKLRKSKRKTH
jgi:nicotinamidase-related amidase